jgi:chromosome partitioning protein
LRRQLIAVDGYDVVLVDCPPSLGVLTLNALAAASRLVVVTEASYLALQGTDELLETHALVRTHYNPGLELVGVIVNRVERTLEHRHSVVEIERYFGAGLVWSPLLPKRTVLQDASRRGVPVSRLTRRVAGEVAARFAKLARRIEGSHGHA